jgi:hypothetical protein
MDGARPIFSGAISLRWNSWALRRTASAEASVRVSIGNFLPKVSELRQLALADEAELPRAYRPRDLVGEHLCHADAGNRGVSFSPVSAASRAQLRTKSGTRDISASVGAPPMTCCYRLHDQET